MEQAVKVRAFGIAREIIGSGDMELELASGTSVLQLKALLQSRFPAFSRLRSFTLAVNGAYCSEDSLIGGGDEVAIIPPVSGG